MKSIRARLLAWLVTAVVAGALAGAAITYFKVLHELEGQFDYQLRQMALSLGEQGFIPPEDAAAIADEQLDFVVQVWTLDGVRIYASRPAVPFPPQVILGFADEKTADSTWRVYSVAARDRVIQVAQPLSVRQELAAQAALRGTLPLLGLAPLLGILVWWTVGASLAPLRRIAGEVKQRGAEALEPLVDAQAPTEIAPLTGAINALLARLRASFAAQRSFVADAAHELRSPLTALHLQAGILERSADGEERRAALAALGAGIERASRLVEQLLTLARQEPGSRESPHEKLDLAEVARLALTDVAALAEQKSIELALHAPTPCIVVGDADGLRILVRNLADNAVRYTSLAGRVEVTLRRDHDVVVLEVDDSGPGIPPAERERVFDRFYRRSNEAATQGSGETGSGLGLAIVRSVAAQHHAQLALLDSPLGGLRVRASFSA